MLMDSCYTVNKGDKYVFLKLREASKLTRLCRYFLTGALIPFSAFAEDTGGRLDPLIIKDRSFFLFQYTSEPGARLVPFFGTSIEQSDPYVNLTETRDTSYTPEKDNNWRAGFRYRFSKTLSLNLDAKQRNVSRSMKIGDSPTDFQVKVKPWEIRLGVSYKW